MSLLFQPLQLQNHTLANRIIVSPMCQYTAEDGFANDWHLVHLGQYAIGRAGAIIQEATAVALEGRITYADLGIWKDEHIAKLKQIVDFVHTQGSKIGLQLAHAGRKASTNKPWLNRLQFPPESEKGWQTVSSSDEGFHSKDVPPLAMSISDIEQCVLDFQLAARRAVKAGYDIIEIHAAHGYLIHQFLSPLINHRNDAYGGSFENRIRLVVEIVDAIRFELTTQSLWIRLSATDWAEGGWNEVETLALIKLLQTKGVELMDISTGGAVRQQQIITGPNYQVPFAAKVKKETGALTGAVGLITEAQQAEEILQKGDADVIFIARAFLKEPHLVYRFAHDLGVTFNWAPQYERGKEDA